MHKNDLSKAIVLGIILLFANVSMLPTINGKFTVNNADDVNNVHDGKISTAPRLIFPDTQQTSCISSPNGTITVSIRGSLSGSDLTSVSKTYKQIVPYPSFTYTEFDFLDINVNPGQTYYIVIQTSDITWEDYLYAVIGKETNYTRGEAWYKSYNSWNPDPTGDFCFETITGSGQVDQYQYEYLTFPEYPEIPYGTTPALEDAKAIAQSFKPTSSSLAKVKFWLVRLPIGGPLEISIKGGIGIQASIKNIEIEEIVNVTSSISFSGGSIIFPPQGNVIKNIGSIAPNEEKTIRAFVLGFGGFNMPMTITISAEYNNLVIIKREFEVMIFLCFVIVLQP
jgi:hypothetical protein